MRQKKSQIDSDGAKGSPPREAPKPDQNPFKPTPKQLAEAWGKTLPDVVGSGCKILFAGINPGLYTAATRTHFGRPGNRFWPGLFQAGITTRQLHPTEQWKLVDQGIGITNLVPWATKSADELSTEQIAMGIQLLRELVAKVQPAWLGVLGVTTLRVALGQKNIGMGPLGEKWGKTGIWVLPNPSGLNAHLKMSSFAHSLAELAIAAGLTLHSREETG